MHKIEYDPEVKVLQIHFKRGKSVDSEIKGNVVLDYDRGGHLVKLEIMEFDFEDFLNLKQVKKKARARV